MHPQKVVFLVTLTHFRSYYASFLLLLNQLQGTTKPSSEIFSRDHFFLREEVFFQLWAEHSTVSLLTHSFENNTSTIIQLIHMTNSGGFARLSLVQQADLIRSVGTLVVKRFTMLRRTELYALDSLFIELSFVMYGGGESVDKIRYINDTASLQPYLDEIKLCL